MNKRIQGAIAPLLFLATLSASPPGQAQETSATAGDQRIPVVLRPDEKAAVLRDMRGYLQGLQEIFTALAKDDMDAVAVRAKALGTVNIFSTYLMFPTASGVMFRNLSAAVHDDFEEIAAAAKTQRNAKATLEKLSTTMLICVTCHQTFRLSDMAHEGR
jgi:hypothetical protein